MTNKQFDEFMERIKTDPASIKKSWFDGHKWIDSNGNWCGWCDCGFSESLFYAGMMWTRTFSASGIPTTPVRHYKY